MTSNASATQTQDRHNSDKIPLNRLEDDLVYEKEILADYEFEGSGSTPPPIESSSAINAWSRKHSCRVLIKRYSKFDPAKVAAVQRELNVLDVLARSDDAIPRLLDYFDPANTVFVVCEDRQDESLRRYVDGRGPLTGDLLKSVMTQLMSALSHIFLNGFAHLRMTDESLYIDQHGQLRVKEFQYAIEYGKEKTDTLYAAVGHDVICPEGIWCAPEVYAAERDGTQYNGRKAVMWTCGVAMYFMVTGQLEKLSNLDHPAFSNHRRSTINHNTASGSTAPPPYNETPDPVAPESPRRFSLGHFRRSSAANTPPHSRKSSVASQIPTPQTLIHYPGSRFEVPNYARDIISKTLVMNPMERAELIEVAAKVPKEFVAKTTRPLMEVAWLDYKNHVGPYAGMGLGAEEWGGDGDASSVYSGRSALSQSFTGFLSGYSARKEANSRVTSSGW